MAAKTTTRGEEYTLRTVSWHKEDRGRSIFRDVRVRIMGRGEWARRTHDDREKGWSGAAMDDGRVLAVQIVPGAEEDVRGRDDPESRPWGESARGFRDRLLRFLEDDPDVRFLELNVGGDGCGTFRVSSGDADLMFSIVRDPDT